MAFNLQARDCGDAGHHPSPERLYGQSRAHAGTSGRCDGNPHGCSDAHNRADTHRRADACNCAVDAYCHCRANPNACAHANTRADHGRGGTNGYASIRINCYPNAGADCYPYVSANGHADAGANSHTHGHTKTAAANTSAHSSQGRSSCGTNGLMGIQRAATFNAGSGTDVP